MGSGQDGVFLVGVDLDQGQEGSREQSPGIGAADLVGIGPSLHERARLLVDLDDVLAAVLCRGDLLLGLLTLDGDPLLLGLEQAHRDGIGVGHLHELQPLGLEACNPSLSARDPLRVVRIAEHERFQLASDRLKVQPVEVDPEVPAALDAFLDVGGR
jgi:hypothetical protein